MQSQQRIPNERTPTMTTNDKYAKLYLILILLTIVLFTLPGIYGPYYENSVIALLTLLVILVGINTFK